MNDDPLYSIQYIRTNEGHTHTDTRHTKYPPSKSQNGEGDRDRARRGAQREVWSFFMHSANKHPSSDGTSDGTRARDSHAPHTEARVARARALSTTPLARARRARGWGRRGAIHPPRQRARTLSALTQLSGSGVVESRNRSRCVSFNVLELLTGTPLQACPHSNYHQATLQPRRKLTRLLVLEDSQDIISAE